MKRGLRQAGFTISDLRQQWYLHNAEKRHYTGVAGVSGVRQNGFTIVEVMIVLAVTTALFVAIAASMAGRTQSAEFSQAIQDTRAQIQQILTEVQAGHYANLNNFNCDSDGTNLMLTNKVSGANEQGSNQGCVFLGQAVHFQVDSSGPDEQYVIYPIAGIQGTTELPITNLAAADPTVIAPTSGKPDLPDDSQPVTLRYGIKTKFMKVNDGGVITDIGALAFITSLGEEKTGDDPAYKPGAIQLDLYGLKHTNLNDNSKTAAANINQALHTTDAVKNPNSITICIQNSSGSKSGLITIGQKNSQLSVDMVIQTSQDCS